ncbi:DUF1275-domain-containing protein [Rozella allomycis CSF55]|uniref:DUF1275-domain-containing protein n=1 Tax=Rozella allomycis (strain CSF55) TaxID=988480 RepID=A0A075ANJ0_ROZAC|nr:Protein of unknown function DUF1275 domain-containing protein [Rozella allomycis CSF55]RKP21811.1 DUF1275-domain-containing protein [Rozella allomycis CSF55]|eukprot:EPZ31427.1 Protein of unknown function DUF1275 domain-containing protein [Rozella allomycis CSF55]
MNTFERKEFAIVVTGGSILSFVAGMINSISLSSFLSVPVTHVTGTVTNIGIDFARTNTSKLASHFGLICSFWIGSLTSGLIVQDGAGNFKLARSYGWVMITETFSILLGYLVLHNGSILGQFLLAFSSGLQNAMASVYSGAVLRTTHMTGILTDLGTLTAQIIFKRGKAKDNWKFGVFIPLFLGYILGATIGCISYDRIGLHTLWIPAFLLGCTGTYYLTSHFVGDAINYFSELENQERMLQIQKEANEKVEIIQDFLLKVDDKAKKVDKLYKDSNEDENYSPQAQNIKYTSIPTTE